MKSRRVRVVFPFDPVSGDFLNTWWAGVVGNIPANPAGQKPLIEIQASGLYLSERGGGFAIINFDDTQLRATVAALKTLPYPHNVSVE